MLGTDSVLVVRRSIFIEAAPERVWREFETFERMNRWWGAMVGDPEAGTANGQRLVAYEPPAGRIEMEVSSMASRRATAGASSRFSRGAS